MTIMRFLTFLFLLLSFAGNAQIWSEDFDGGNTTNPVFNPDGCFDTGSQTDYFDVVCPDGVGCTNEIPNDYIFNNVSGQHFGVRDMDADPCSSTQNKTFSFSGIDVSSCAITEVLYVCFEVAESRNMGDAAGSEWGTSNMREDTWDGNSSMNLSASIDGNPLTPVTAINNQTIVRDGSNTRSDVRPGIDVNCSGESGDAGEPELTDTFTKYCFELPTSGGALTLNFEVNGLNTQGEDLAIDNIEVYCNATPADGTLLDACTPWEPGVPSTCTNTTLFFENFDGSNTTNPPILPACDASPSRDYLGIVCNNGAGCTNEINSDYLYFGATGQYFGVRDMDNVCNGSLNETLSFTGIDISGCMVDCTAGTVNNIYLCVDMAESQPNNGREMTGSPPIEDSWDGSSNVNFSVSIDDCDFEEVTAIESINGTNSRPAIDLNCGGGSATTDYLLSDNFQTFCFQLPSLGSSLDLNIEINELNTDGEDIAIDNIQIICSNSSTCLSPVIPTCSDPAEAVTITCPADVTTSCDATDPANTGMATAPPTCSTPVITFTDETTQGTAGCSLYDYTITRTWTATDANGCAECVQIITVTDTEGPMITCPADITIGCDESTDPGTGGGGGGGSTGTTTLTGTPGSSWASTVNISEIVGSGAIPADATITDVDINLGIDHSWTGDLNVELVGPDGTAVDILLADCGNDSNINATFDDEAGGPIACSGYDGNVGGVCNDDYLNDAAISGTLQPVGTLSDLDGLAAAGDWTINIDDDVAGDGGCFATFSITVAWEVAPPTGDGTGVATAADACDPDVTITFEDVLNPLPDGYSISRTWTAMDACGNSNSCVQTITVDGCDLGITDPCVCLDNSSVIDLDAGTGGDDGQFSELVAVTGPGGGPIADPNLIFEVIAITGGVDAFAPAPIPPAQTPGVPVPIGTQLVWNPATMHYELPFYHYDAVGYTISVQQIVAGVPGQILSVGNTCVYPNPVFDPVIADLYCPDDAAVTLGGMDLGGLGSDAVSFTIDGAAATELDPAALALGAHTIVMTWDGAEGTNDGSGTVANPNEPGCIQTVQKVFEVNDTEPPMITCPANVTLQCTESTDPANTGMATAMDNCNTPPVIEFSDLSTQGAMGCSQYEYTITRTWTATDGQGNTATCVQTINVEDTTAPVITCPPAQTLSCFETLPAPFNNAADFIAAGGTVSDDCTMDLGEFTVFTQNDDNGGDNCPGNARSVVRTYFIADACGNTSTCTQIFTYLESTQSPVITSILPTCYKYCASLANPMEDDITYDVDCSFGATVNITGPTQIGQDNCPGSIYRYTYTVTDDCGRTSAPVTRDFIIGNDGPTIECAPFNLLLECGDPNNSDYIADHVASVTANTSCELGYTINHFPQNFNNITCNSSTVVTFVATDDCGRTASCTSTINISDNTAPEITSTYVDGVCNEAVCGSNVNFWFNEWKDKVLEGLTATDACDTNVSFSTSGPNSPNQDCPDGTAETVITFIANDNCGNTSGIDYSFYVVPADTPAPSPGIMGMVATEQLEAVANVTVTLDGNNAIQTMVTETDGNYNFSDLVLDQNYSVTPYLNEDPLNGVSSFDLVLISKHILQIELLDSPYKMIAADVNKSGGITTMDLVDLRKLILHVTEEFDNNTSWRFVETAYLFPDPTNPFATIFPEEVFINGLTADELHDFVGVKIGDVNGSATANGLVGAEDRTMVDDLVFELEDQKVVAGQTVDVTFRSDNFNAIHGYQFSLDFDQTVLQFDAVQTGTLTNMAETNFGLAQLDKGVITTSWTNDKAQSAMRDADLFTISFIANADGQLSDLISVNSSFTKAEAYNGNLDLMDVQMRFDEAAVVTNELRLYQNIPNPFKQETLVGFDLPESSKATLSVFNSSGQLLNVVEGDFEKGYNNVTISNEGLTSGLLYYQLVTPTGSITKKMILK